MCVRIYLLHLGVFSALSWCAIRKHPPQRRTASLHTYRVPNTSTIRTHARTLPLHRSRLQLLSHLQVLRLKSRGLGRLSLRLRTRRVPGLSRLRFEPCKDHVQLFVALFRCRRGGVARHKRCDVWMRKGASRGGCQDQVQGGGVETP